MSASVTVVCYKSKTLLTENVSWRFKFPKKVGENTKVGSFNYSVKSSLSKFYQTFKLDWKVDVFDSVELHIFDFMRLKPFS